MLHMEIDIFFFFFLFLVVNTLHTTSIVNAKPSILLTLDIFDGGKDWVTKEDGTWLFMLKTNTFKSLNLKL